MTEWTDELAELHYGGIPDRTEPIFSGAEVSGWRQVFANTSADQLYGYGEDGHFYLAGDAVTDVSLLETDGVIMHELPEGGIVVQIHPRLATSFGHTPPEAA